MGTREEEVRKLVNQWRQVLDAKKRNVCESVSDNEDDGVVPYEHNEQVVNDIIDSSSTEFGAKFDKYKNPVVYVPSTEDVVVYGDIPSLGNETKFEFHYRPEHAGEECIIHTNTLVINEDVLAKLNKMYGVYKNWKERTLDSMQDIKPMSMHNSDNSQNSVESENLNGKNIVPGDDLD